MQVLAFIRWKAAEIFSAAFSILCGFCSALIVAALAFLWLEVSAQALGVEVFGDAVNDLRAAKGDAVIENGGVAV